MTKSTNIIHNFSSISLIQSFDDEKSKTATTMTFRTTDTALSKI